MAGEQIPEPGEPIQLREFFLEDRRFCAVYFLYHRGEVVYVGQTRTLRFRIDQHLAEGKKTFDAIGFVRCKLGDLSRIESHYIRLLAPKYNACGLSKKMRERESWVREQDRASACRPDAFSYLIEASATCGTSGDDGQIYIRRKEYGTFLQITDKDASDILGGLPDKVPFMQLLYLLASSPDLRAAQSRFEQLV